MPRLNKGLPKARASAARSNVKFLYTASVDYIVFIKREVLVIIEKRNFDTNAEEKTGKGVPGNGRTDLKLCPYAAQFNNTKTCYLRRRGF